ncbi:GNAT family N-acetyltransferase [soil metagenome]
MATLETARLRLRPWRDEDLEPLSELGRDPEVMAHFPALLAADGNAALLGRLRALIEERGHGFWAVEVRGGAPLIGFCGIKDVTCEAPCTPAVEVGWRLARAHWGHGYASEAARAAVAYGFDELELSEIVSFLLPANRRSAAVCERLGMTRDPAEDFDHPWFADGQLAVGGQPLRRHALYRLRRP